MSRIPCLFFQHGQKSNSDSDRVNEEGQHISFLKRTPRFPRILVSKNDARGSAVCTYLRVYCLQRRGKWRDLQLEGCQLEGWRQACLAWIARDRTEDVQQQRLREDHFGILCGS